MAFQGNVLVEIMWNNRELPEIPESLCEPGALLLKHFIFVTHGNWGCLHSMSSQADWTEQSTRFPYLPGWGSQECRIRRNDTRFPVSPAGSLGDIFLKPGSKDRSFSTNDYYINHNIWSSPFLSHQPSYQHDSWQTIFAPSACLFWESSMKRCNLV